MSWSLPHLHPHQAQDIPQGPEGTEREEGCSQGATAGSVPHGCCKRVYVDVACFGQMEMEAHTAVGSLHMGDTGQIIYMRLSGLNGGT